MKRAVFLLCFFAFASPLIFSIPLENLVSSSNAAKLRSSGEPIVETQSKNPAPSLLPQDSELRRIVGAAVDSLEANTLIEALYLYKKPAAAAAAFEGWTQTQRTGVFNQILAVSTMTGLQYYSASRRTTRTFYESSFMVDGPEAKNRIPDPVFTTVPQTLTTYAKQKDLTFGDNIYRYDYIAAQDAFYIIQDNITALTIAFVPVIGRGHLKSVIAIIDCGDSILVYAVSIAKAVSVPGLMSRVVSSFSNRVEAVLSWFTGRLDNTFQSPF